MALSPSPPAAPMRTRRLRPTICAGTCRTTWRRFAFWTADCWWSTATPNSVKWETSSHEKYGLAGGGVRGGGGWVRGFLDLSGAARLLQGLHRVQWPARLPDGVRRQPHGGAEDGHDQCLCPVGRRSDRFGELREYDAG